MAGWLTVVAAGTVAAVLAGACTAPEVQKDESESGVTARDQRMEELERRLRRLEQGVRPAANTYPAAPLQTSVEKERLSRERLEILRQRHRALLEKYTPRHPEVIFLEREIRRQESLLPSYEAPLREIPAQSSAP